MPSQITLQCRQCGHTVPEKQFSLTCPVCAAPMRVMVESDAWESVLTQTLPAGGSRSFLHQWQALLPIADGASIDAVSLGEAESPLLRAHRYGAKRGVPDLYFKLEMGPTLSLKDRGTALCVLKAREFGCKTVCVSSSGNNAASVAAYGSRAGLDAVVFVQKHVSPAKIFKSLVYGARVVRVDGDMAAASSLCAKMVNKYKWFQCGGPNPYRLSAKRTVAFGIVQQLGKAPDTVLAPCGGGAGLVSLHDGFRELLAAGVIERMPRLVGVQLAACNPTAQAFFAGKTRVTPVQKMPSLSDAIMNNNPYWGEYCLQAVRETGGTMVSVSDTDFIQTIRTVGREEGIFTEPAGAVSVAALTQLVKMEGFENPGVTVCTLTGHGLNAPQIATREDEVPDTVPPTLEAVEAFMARTGGIGKPE